MRSRAALSALTAVFAVLMAAGPASAAPGPVAPPYDEYHAQQMCPDPSFPPIRVGTCEVSGTADASGRFLATGTTTYSGFAVLDADFAKYHAVKRATSITYDITLRVDRLSWQNASGSASVDFVLSHSGCSCFAGGPAASFDSSTPERIGESHTYTYTLTNPSGGQMPSGTVSLVARWQSQSSGGSDLEAGVLNVDVSFASITATATR